MDDEAAMGLARMLSADYDYSWLGWISLFVLVGNLEALDIQATKRLAYALDFEKLKWACFRHILDLPDV